ncbi:MAG: hypothetical protein LUE29_11075 [Lachnospiraceae bacterium]|nr:hypothetical protein [Lachnospiraceae bacterium]
MRMRRRTSWDRLLALVMVIAMVMTLMPSSKTLADTGDGSSDAEETAVIDENAITAAGNIWTVTITQTDTSDNQISGTVTWLADGDETATETDSSFQAEDGWTGEIAVTAPDGYRISGVTVTSGGVSEAESVDDNSTIYSVRLEDVSSDTTIAVVYQKTWRVSVVHSEESAPGQYAAIDLNGVQESSLLLDTDQTLSYSITAPANYYIVSVTIDGAKAEDLTDGATQYDGSIIADASGSDRTIAVTLAQITYTVVATFSEGSVTVTDVTTSGGTTELVSNAVTTIYSGNQYTFAAVPPTGYRTTSVIMKDASDTVIDSQTYTENDAAWSYTLDENGADSDYTIQVEFALNVYTVSAEVSGTTGDHCTIRVNDENESVTYGSSAIFQLTFEDGYYIDSILVASDTDDGKEYSYTLVENSYTENEDGTYSLSIAVADVDSDLNVTAYFAAMDDAAEEYVIGTISEDGIIGSADQYEIKTTEESTEEVYAFKISDSNVGAALVSGSTYSVISIGTKENSVAAYEVAGTASSGAEDVTITKLYFAGYGLGSDDELSEITYWTSVDVNIRLTFDDAASVTKFTATSQPNQNGYYRGDVVFSVAATDIETDDYAGILSVEWWVGDETPTNGTTKIYESNTTLAGYDADKADISVPADGDSELTFTISAARYNGDDTVWVQVTDMIGNVTKISTIVSICNTTINITMDGTQETDAIDGYYTKRTAEITITESENKFDSSNVTILATCTDADGNIVAAGEVGDNSTAGYYTISRWSQQNSVSQTNTEIYTATVTFTGDANYEWSLSYKNDAGFTYEANSESLAASVTVSDNTAAESMEYIWAFTVDETNPTGYISLLYDATKGSQEDENTEVSSLVFEKKLYTDFTFENWFYEVSEAEAVAEDDLSGVQTDRIYYYKYTITSETYKELDEEDLDKLWSEFLADTTSETFTTEPYSVSEDESFVIYARIVDKAGNYAWISTDGVIVDRTPPKAGIEVTTIPSVDNNTLEVQGYFNDDVDLTITAADESGSGIKKMYYTVQSEYGSLEDTYIYIFSGSGDAGDNSFVGTETTDEVTGQVTGISADVTISADKYPYSDLIITLTVVDGAGNTATSTVALDIDSTEPTVNIDVTTDVSADNENEDVKGYFNGDVDLTLQINDPAMDGSESGLEKLVYTVVSEDGNINDTYTYVFGGKTEGSEDEDAYLFYGTETTDDNGNVTEIVAYITIPAAKYNYCDVAVTVTATDCAGNDHSDVVKFDIDQTAPVINISYDNNEINEADALTDGNGKGQYFDAVRKATITITERTSHFDAEDVLITITAVDVDGNWIATETDGTANVTSPVTITNADGDVIPYTIDTESGEVTLDYSRYTWTTVEGSDVNDAEHTIFISYDADANYTFAIFYGDVAANDVVFLESESLALYKFTVDTTDPGGYLDILFYATKLEKDEENAEPKRDTFGTKLYTEYKFEYWYYEVTEVVAVTNDDTAGVQEDKIYYYKQTLTEDAGEPLNGDDLDALWAEYLNGTTEETFTAEPYAVSADETFVIYSRITDKSGNVTWISTDSAIVDTTAPVIDIDVETDPAAENGNDDVMGCFYGDVVLSFTIEDPAAEGCGSESGLAAISYTVSSEDGEINDIYTYLFADDVSEEMAGADNFEGTETCDILTGLVTKVLAEVTISAAAYNYSDVVVTVTATDHAGNEYVTSVALDIDATAPTIAVSYDNNDAKNAKYFDAVRTAEIKITERTNHFDASDVLFTVTAVDAYGESIESPLIITNGDGDVIPYMLNTDGTLTIDYSTYTWTTVESYRTDGTLIEDEATQTLYITFNADANYTFAVEYTDEAGNINKEPDVGGSVAPYDFVVDTVSPLGAVTISDNTWDDLRSILGWYLFSNSSVSASVYAEDATSPVSVDYFVTSKTDPVYTVATLNALAESAWTNVANPYELKSHATIFSQSTDEQLAVYMRITDYAGHVTYVDSDGYIVDKTAPLITFTAETPKVGNEVNGVYGYYGLENGETVTIDVDVTDIAGGSWSGLKSVNWWVECNGKTTQEGTWVSYTDEDQSASLSDLISEISRTISVDAAANDSCNVTVFVTAVDNAGNATTSSIDLDIDVTAPAIAVSYDNNTARNGSYFDATRTATIVITERTDHFDADDVNITITATDVNGNTVSGISVSNMLSAWKTVEGSDENAATHTATITYSADANYTFAISYTDAAGNTATDISTGTSVAPYQFTVDKTSPTGTVTWTSNEGSTGNSSTLVRTLTFGFYSKTGITVTSEQSDVTSPVESVEYYKTASTIAMTKSSLDSLDGSAWSSFRNFSVTSDEQFTIYLKIRDYAGNYTYISTDGLIVDETLPVEETLAPEITLTQPADGYYTEDVTVDVVVTDPTSGSTYSGLKSVTYEIYSLGVLTGSGVLFDFTTENPTQSQLQQSISDSIAVNAQANNSNEVEVIVYAEDNAGNTSQKNVTFLIDVTAPTILISYDNNSSDSDYTDYFNQTRTATITVTERNFDEQSATVTIVNEDGTYIPTMSRFSKTGSGTGNGDDAQWTATIVYDTDGVYSFEITCEDDGGNQASGVAFATGTVAGDHFTIDRTIPAVSVSYRNSNAENDNYYKDVQTAVITITEHNFDASRVTVTVTSDGSTMAVTPTWSSRGDVRTAEIVFEDDALYTFDIAFTDEAGNDAADYSMDTFYVDKIFPEITIAGVENESANKGDVEPFITVTDTNYNVNDIVIELVGRRYGEEYSYTIADITDGQTFAFENIATDDIYDLTVTATDMAGNTEQEAIVFSVNRNGSTYDLSAIANLNGAYLTADSMDDLIIGEVNPNELSDIVITLYKNGEAIVLTEGVDYEIIYEVGENGWYYYTYTIYKAAFKDDGLYSVQIFSTDSAGNEAVNTLDTKASDIEFSVDNTKPTIIVANLESGRTYNSENYEVVMEIKDMYLASITVELDGVEVAAWSGDELQAIVDEDGDFAFSISESNSVRTVTITATDEAGNVQTTSIERFYVTTSAWVRFYTNTPLLVGTVVGIAAMIALIIFLILFGGRKKKDKEAKKATEA